MPMNLNPKDSSEVSHDVMAQIRDACRLLGISQKDLALNLDLKPSQMNLYFNGKVEMRADRLLAVLEILGIDVRQQLYQKIGQLKGETDEIVDDGTIMAKIGRLQSPKRESLFKIIEVLAR